MSACLHPQEQRWQTENLWRCCACHEWFWGSKREQEPRPIYASVSREITRTVRRDVK